MSISGAGVTPRCCSMTVLSKYPALCPTLTQAVWVKTLRNSFLCIASSEGLYSRVFPSTERKPSMRTSLTVPMPMHRSPAVRLSTPSVSTS